MLSKYPKTRKGKENTNRLPDKQTKQIKKKKKKKKNP